MSLLVERLLSKMCQLENSFSPDLEYMSIFSLSLASFVAKKMSFPRDSNHLFEM